MRTLTLTLLGVAVAALLVACPPHNTPQPVPPGDPGEGYEPPAPIDAGPADAMVSEAAGADGTACTLDDDCASGVCEGLGCEEGQGVCAPATRGCTKDLRQYCGCDGITFQSSGSCPGQRYAATGACP